MSTHPVLSSEPISVPEGAIGAAGKQSCAQSEDRPAPLPNINKTPRRIAFINPNRGEKLWTASVIPCPSEPYVPYPRKSPAHERVGNRPDAGSPRSRDPGENQRSGSARIHRHSPPRRSSGATAVEENRHARNPQRAGGDPGYQSLPRRFEYGGYQT